MIFPIFFFFSLVSYVAVSASPFNVDVGYEDVKAGGQIDFGLNGKGIFPNSEVDFSTNGKDNFGDSEEDNNNYSTINQFLYSQNGRYPQSMQNTQSLLGRRPAPDDTYGIPPSLQDSFDASKFLNNDQLDDKNNAYVIKDDYPPSTQNKSGLSGIGDIIKEQFNGVKSLFHFRK